MPKRTGKGGDGDDESITTSSADEDDHRTRYNYAQPLNVDNSVHSTRGGSAAAAAVAAGAGAGLVSVGVVGL